MRTTRKRNPYRRDLSKTNSYGKLFIARVGKELKHKKPDIVVKWQRCHIYRWYGTHFVSACQRAKYKGDRLKATTEGVRFLSADYSIAEYVKTYKLEDVPKIVPTRRCEFCFPSFTADFKDNYARHRKSYQRAEEWRKEYVEQESKDSNTSGDGDK